MYDILQLNDMLVPELKDLAEKIGIKGYKRLNKQDLIYKILDQQAISGEKIVEPSKEKPSKETRTEKEAPKAKKERPKREKPTRPKKAQKPKEESDSWEDVGQEEETKETAVKAIKTEKVAPRKSNLELQQSLP